MSWLLNSAIYTSIDQKMNLWSTYFQPRKSPHNLIVNLRSKAN